MTKRYFFNTWFCEEITLDERHQDINSERVTSYPSGEVHSPSIEMMMHESFLGNRLRSRAFTEFPEQFF